MVVSWTQIRGVEVVGYSLFIYFIYMHGYAHGFNLTPLMSGFIYWWTHNLMALLEGDRNFWRSLGAMSLGVVYLVTGWSLILSLSSPLPLSLLDTLSLHPGCHDVNSFLYTNFWYQLVLPYWFGTEKMAGHFYILYYIYSVCYKGICSGMLLLP